MADGRDGVSAALTSYVIRHKYVLLQSDVTLAKQKIIPLPPPLPR